MSEIILEHGENSITVSEFGYPTYTFQIVDFVPLGYEIWNIGNHIPKGYLPLCRLSPQQAFPGGRAIETDTLKVIVIEGAEKILAACGGGQSTIKSMEQYVKRYKNSKRKWTQTQVQRMREALPIMRKIKGLEG